MAEPDLITRSAVFADRHLGLGDRTNGFYVDFGKMIPGAGWLSGGPGYRHWYAKDQVFVDGSAAISWHRYKSAQARFELPKIGRSRLAAGSHFRWQDFGQVDYFGEGPGTRAAGRTVYHLDSRNLVGYTTLRPVRWIDLTAQVGWLHLSLPVARTFVHREASIAVDTRDFPAHASRGGLVRVGAARYSDRDAGAFNFKRYEGEVAGFVPIAGARVVLAVHGWMVASEVMDGQAVPFYLQPSLGGANTLRSYADYRFHDRNMLVANAELRFAMMTHVDAALFVDAGNVAARVRDLDVRKRSYGAGFRLHTRRQTIARIDAATGDEGWRFLFRLTDPLELARVSRRTAAVPFVP